MFLMWNTKWIYPAEHGFHVIDNPPQKGNALQHANIHTGVQNVKVSLP